MESKKSERNQQISNQRKLENKQRSVVQPKLSAPRFAPGIVIPEVPEGMVLGKFFGEPILLPAIEEDEPMLGRSRYSLRQTEILLQLEQTRRGKDRISTQQSGLF